MKKYNSKSIIDIIREKIKNNKEELQKQKKNCPYNDWENDLSYSINYAIAMSEFFLPFLLIILMPFCVSGIPIHSEILAILNVGCPLGISYIRQRRDDKKKLKKYGKIREYNSKNQEDYYQQSIKNTIEMAKANNKIETLEKVEDIIENSEPSNNKYEMDNQYDDIVGPSNMRCYRNISNLMDNLNKKAEELDTLTTQKILWEEYNKKYSWKKNPALKRIIILGLVVMANSYLPHVCMSGGSTFLSPITCGLTLGTALALGLGATSAFYIKKERDHKKALNSLNAGLGENALSEELINDKNGIHSLSKKVEEKQKEMITIGKQLRNERAILKEIEVTEQAKDIKLRKELDQIDPSIPYATSNEERLVTALENYGLLEKERPKYSTNQKKI